MKYKLSMLVSLFFTAVGFAQATFPESLENTKTRKQEVRLGAVKLLAGEILEVGYEYAIGTNQGFGANVLINFTRNNDYFEDYALNPYYRMYFNSSTEYGMKGFFVEGFLNFYSGRDYENEYYGSVYDMAYYEERKKEFFETAIGLALGKKWVSTSGFVLEVKAGAGRNLLGNSSNDAVFKGDLSIGYRF